jgi:hypothetical protein
MTYVILEQTIVLANILIPEIVACIYCLFFFIFKSPCYNCGFKGFIPKFVMASNPVMELDIWKGEWGLPSIDVNCLEVMVRDRRN